MRNGVLRATATSRPTGDGTVNDPGGNSSGRSPAPSAVALKQLFGMEPGTVPGKTDGQPAQAPPLPRYSSVKSLLRISLGSPGSALGECTVSNRKCSACGNARRNIFAFSGSFSKLATTSPR